MKPVSIFISYSHRDEEFRDELVRHLSPLKRAGLIEAWHDRVLRPGMNWAIEIDRKIEEADPALCTQIAELRQQGLGMGAIGKRLGLSSRTVWR